MCSVMQTIRDATASEVRTLRRGRNVYIVLLLLLLLGRIAVQVRRYAACWYRHGSVVCRSVGLYVSVVSPAKPAQSTEMPFGLRTRIGPKNHVLSRGSMLN